MAGNSSNPESIFFAALEKPTAQEQAAYLDQACGQDAQLRQRVEKLLTAQPRLGSFLEEPLTDLAEAHDPTRSQEGPGTSIGPYKLLQEIGEGGFGIVYMAEQLEPVRRQVALKIIKPGMDTREVIARFEAERQALAMMDHSNIARVFDGGETESGRPYFVMELVKGVPITEFCDKNSLETDQRLELFMTVCQAVQHAHQKGIIHRDLKPSNIMITLHDGDPIPKVIDFGVSKAISQRLTEKTLFTRYGQMIGTPQYMSPEQAEMSGLDVDTRSDIYSLGILLYELLTGTTPLEAARLRTAGYNEMLRMIQIEEPLKPSTRVSSLGDSLTVVCGHRNTDARRLRQLMRGDLDWIVMKALEKHRERRYETANELARDIRRHLNQEPVAAGPPSATYRLSKLVRRNKVLVAASACVLVALVIGLAVAAFGFAQAVHQRGLAQASEQVAIDLRNVADNARDEAANHARQLERQVSLMHVSNANRAITENNLVRANIELAKCEQDHRGWVWQFLEDRAGTSLSDSVPGSGQPYFTSDGKRVLVIGRSESQTANKVLVWDVSSGTRQMELTHDIELMSLALSSDDKLVAAGDVNGGLILWNLQTSEHVWVRKRGREKRVKAMAFHPERALLVTIDDGHLLQGFATTAAGTEEFTCQLPVEDIDRFSKVPDSPQKRKGAIHEAHYNQKVMFSSNGRWLAVGGRKRSFLIDVSTQTVVREFPPGTKVPTFSPTDGRMIATGNAQERSVTLWDWDGDNLDLRTKWRGASSGRFHDLCFSVDGSHLVAAQGNYVTAWNVHLKRRVAAIQFNGGHTSGGFTYWLAMSPTGNMVACCGDKGDVLWGGDLGLHFWKYTHLDDAIVQRPHENANQLVKFSPHGDKLAVGSHRGQQGLSGGESPGPVIILDSDTGKQIGKISHPCRGFSWMPDNERIMVTRAQKATHEMYQASTGELVHKFDGNTAVSRPYVDRQGQVLTSLGMDSADSSVRIRIWDVASTHLMKEISAGNMFGGGNIRRPDGGYWNAAVSPKGQLVGIAAGGTVRLLDTRTGTPLPSIPYKGRIEETLAFNRGGDKILVTTGEDKFAIYDVKLQRWIREFVGPTGQVAISPNDKQIVSSGDGVVVWDVATGLPMITLSGTDNNDFVSVDWCSENRRIAAGKTDGSVHIWSLPVRP